MSRTLNGNLRGRAARMTVDDLMNIESRAQKFERLLGELQQIDENWMEWWDGIDVPTNYAMIPHMEQRIADIHAQRDQEWLALAIVAEYTPPEPAEALDWPWTDEDQLDELANRRPETTF